jgi:hypothetical protein
MIKKLYSYISLILILNMVSCSRRPSTFLDVTDCQAPCWRGISIGTNQENVLRLLKQMPDVNPDTIITEKDNTPMMEIGIKWTFRNNRDHGTILLHNNKVTEIFFPSDNQMLLSDFTKEFGNPDLIYLDKEILDGVYITVNFLYIQKGICLTNEPFFLPFYNPSKVSIGSTSKIKRIYYADPSIPEWQLKIGCLRGMESDVYNFHVQNWTGYGTYNFK